MPLHRFLFPLRHSFGIRQSALGNPHPPHFRVLSGSFGGRFGVVWGSFWGRFGVVSGSFWGRFGVVWGSVWGRFLKTLGQQLPARPAPTRFHPTKNAKFGRHPVTQRNTTPILGPFSPLIPKYDSRTLTRRFSRARRADLIPQNPPTSVQIPLSPYTLCRS